MKKIITALAAAAVSAVTSAVTFLPPAGKIVTADVTHTRPAARYCPKPIRLRHPESLRQLARQFPWTPAELLSEATDCYGNHSPSYDGWTPNLSRLLDGKRGQDILDIKLPNRRQGQGRGYTQQLPKPSDFASHEELMGNQAGIYDLTDDVPDGDFEAALSEAKTDGNLSRANVVRKIRAATDPAATDRSHAAVQRLDLIREWAEQGHSSRQIAGHLNLAPAYVRKIARDARIEIKADAVVGRSQRIDSNRVVSETVGAMEGIASGIRLVDIEDRARGYGYREQRISTPLVTP